MDELEKRLRREMRVRFDAREMDSFFAGFEPPGPAHDPLELFDADDDDVRSAS